MSKFELPRFYRLIIKQCLVGLVLYSLVLSQTGCIFDRCSYWYIGFTPFCNSDSEVLETEELAVQQLEPPRLPYTYLDGIAVGKQYAMNYGITEGIQPNSPLPRQLAEAGLGEAFDAGCRDGINLYYRDQLASQQLQMANQPLPANLPREETQMNPFAEVSGNTVINPSSNSAIDPYAMMLVRKSDYPLVSTKSRNDKGLKKDLEANKELESRAKIRFENISSDRVNVKDGSEIAPEADDLFTHTEALTPPEPKVESAPLQIGPRTSSRTKVLKNKTPNRPAIYSRSFDLPNTERIPERQDVWGQGKQTALPIPATPSPAAALGETPSASPTMLVLRAEVVRQHIEPTETTDLSSVASPTNSDKRPANQNYDAPEETLLEAEFTIESSEDLTRSSHGTPAREQVIRLTARPESQVFRPTARKTETPSEPKTTTSVSPVGISSVLVDTLEPETRPNESTSTTTIRPDARNANTPSLDDSAIHIHSVLVAELPTLKPDAPPSSKTDSSKVNGKTSPASGSEASPTAENRSVPRSKLNAVLKPRSRKR